MKRCPVCLSDVAADLARCPVCAEPFDDIHDELPAEDTQEHPLPAPDSIAHLQAFERLLDESDLDRSVVDQSLPPHLADRFPDAVKHTAELPAVDIVDDELRPVITVFEGRRPRLRVVIDELPFRIGRRDPVAGYFPELDLTALEESSVVSRRHARIIQEDDTYILEPISTAGTQIGSRLLHPGDQAPLLDGDLIVLSGAFVLKFAFDDVD